MTAKNKPNEQSLPDVAALQDQVKTLDENWKRALADYQNLLRRVDHDKKEFTKLSNANLVARLLPSLDIIEMAASHTQDMGVQMAAKQFHDALKEEGLEIISPAPGTPYSHEQMEAAEVVDAQAGETPETIAELVLKGYKIGDYVLRPARVKVYKSADNSSQSQEENV